MNTQQFQKILYGGDYNPNQWPENVWKEDMRLFEKASINSTTINVFSWAQLQPSEERYDFEQLDRIFAMLEKNNYGIVLGTSTASLPAWMVKRYPEVARTDFEGRQHKFGQRHNACPNSLVYQKFASQLVEKLAERYGNHPNLVCWHINNEYGGECYSDISEKAFRVWVRERYQTIENLNEAWNLSFWGHTIYDWDEIVLPNALGDAIGYENTAFAGLSIDFRRFNSDSLLNNFKMERDIIRRYDQKNPITTNLMGTYKGLDYFKWAKEMDIVSWDNYPSHDTPPSKIAMTHDLMRGLKNGAPFMLMEQTPSQQNWQPYNSLKKPGQMRAQSYQAIAHGSDTVQFFQLRRSVGGCEKFHGAVISHAGHEDTRVFKEVAQLGSELSHLGTKLLGARSRNKVGIIFDWDNYWALEYTSGPNQDLKYVDQIYHYYQACYDNQVSVDMISVDSDFEAYDLVIAPVLYMVKEGLSDRIESYVSQGGHFMTTFMSGIVNESDNVYLGGYPGPLRKLLGIWVEEIDSLAHEQKNEVRFTDGMNVETGLLCDLLHLEGAESLATYQHDFYAGMPAVTVHNFGQGKSWYIGTQLEEDGLTQFMQAVFEELDIQPNCSEKTSLEIVKREKDGICYTFVLNLTNQIQKLPGEFKGKIDLLSEQELVSDEVLPFEVYILSE